MKKVVIYGPPGTGKTTRLLNIVEQEMHDGIAPDRIAFVTFTKKAAKEAISRATTKFNLSASDFPYFRTLHSLAFMLLGLEKKDVMQSTNYQELCNELKLPFKDSFYFDEEELTFAEIGDKFIFANSLARNALMDPRSWWLKNKTADLDQYQYDLFNRGLNRYKVEAVLFDFTDFLERLLSETIFLDVDVAIVDEAQDLTLLQWKVVEQLFKNVRRMYAAGDDDQAIYSWAGADVTYFINQRSDEQIVLENSWRVPKKVFDFSNRISTKIIQRIEKKWVPLSTPGDVIFHTYLESVKLDGNWLLLARNKFLLKELKRYAMENGVLFSTIVGTSVNKKFSDAAINWERLRRGEALMAGDIQVIYSLLARRCVSRGSKQLMIDDTTRYTIVDLKRDHGLKTDRIWHEVMEKIPLAHREYMIALLRKGIKLNSTPAVHISTIHGVKGGEADNVLLLTDVAWASYQAQFSNSDDEHRVFYVGATRAKKTLHILLPRTENCYEI